MYLGNRIVLSCLVHSSRRQHPSWRNKPISTKHAQVGKLVEGSASDRRVAFGYQRRGSQGESRRGTPAASRASGSTSVEDAPCALSPSKQAMKRGAALAHQVAIGASGGVEALVTMGMVAPLIGVAGMVTAVVPEANTGVCVCFGLESVLLSAIIPPRKHTIRGAPHLRVRIQKACREAEERRDAICPPSPPVISPRHTSATHDRPLESKLHGVDEAGGRYPG